MLLSGLASWVLQLAGELCANNKAHRRMTFISLSFRCLITQRANKVIQNSVSVEVWVPGAKR